MRMFGTNGVRGIANDSLSCELALRMGKSIGTVLGPTVALAYDTRTSSRMIRDAVRAGLVSVGADVIDLGMIPTPALQHYVKMRPGITGGVMITASHNPPEYNGIKCISGDGTECSHEEEQRIEDVYAGDIPCVGWDSIGTVRYVLDAAEEYVDSIVSKVDVESIRAAGLTVCVDCANGASVETAPMLMSRLGVRAITINGNPQGEFPGHPSEPTEENLENLKRLVVDTGADLGIAHDGDADRCVFVTSDGRFVSGDLSLALLARNELSRKSGGKVMVTVATSKVVEDTVEANGGMTMYTAVGSPIVAREMISEGGIFGGEENGGLIFADHQYCRDGGMGAARMLESIAKNGPLSEQVDSLPKYRTIKRAVRCPDCLKTEVIETVCEMHKDGRIDRRDGLRIDFDDGWVLIRPSGTEPKFRIYSESRDGAIAEARSESFVKEIEDIIGKRARSLPDDLPELRLELHHRPHLGGVYAAVLRHVQRHVVSEDDRPEHVLQRGCASEPDDLRRSATVLELLGDALQRPGAAAQTVVRTDQEDEQVVLAVGIRPTGHLEGSQLRKRLAEGHELGVLVDLGLPSERHRLHAHVRAYDRDLADQGVRQLVSQ